jgi:NAD(P)-dependent dehydrogenase (short-subunit alcohol dehydrogenase family)
LHRNLFNHRQKNKTLLLGLIEDHKAAEQFVTFKPDNRPKKISPFRPNGDFHALRYSGLAVGDYSVTSKCLAHESLHLVQCPGWSCIETLSFKPKTPTLRTRCREYCQSSQSEGDKMMQKTILVTGSTDGIGLETARMLVSLGHNVLLHGRNPAKLEKVEKTLSALPDGGGVESYVSDLSRMAAVEALARAVAENHEKLDVLINNAGVYRVAEPVSQDGFDTRFAVNTIAPYLLTQRLLPLLGASGRVINLSSAAQSPVDPEAMVGRVRLSDGAAYAQSKLAITMWSRSMALSFKDDGPAIIAVNPGSMLGSKMVKEAYGVAGGDLRIGADILCRAALSEEFAAASGRYFDNDIGQFASPHPDALNSQKCEEIVRVIQTVSPT